MMKQFLSYLVICLICLSFTAPAQAASNPKVYEEISKQVRQLQNTIQRIDPDEQGAVQKSVAGCLLLYLMGCGPDLDEDFCSCTTEEEADCTKKCEEDDKKGVCTKQQMGAGCWAAQCSCTKIEEPKKVETAE